MVGCNVHAVKAVREPGVADEPSAAPDRALAEMTRTCSVTPPSPNASSHGEEMTASLRISKLADHPEAIPVIQRWFETEWAAYYGPGGRGDAEQDLLAYSSRDKLPIGLIAFYADQLCGIAALKADSIRTYTHLAPWVAAGLVLPQFRGRGIGSSLLRSLEEVARGLGYSTVYCGTATAMGLLERNGWQFMERVRYDGEDVSIYQKALQTA